MQTTLNIYQVKNEDIVQTQRLFAASLKYLCEINKRKKDGGDKPYACWNYNEYIARFYLLTNKNLDFSYNREKLATPDSFMKLIVSENGDIHTLIHDAVSEFLWATSKYLFLQTGVEHKITFLPFYFDQSFDAKIGEKYGDYVRFYLMKELKYSAKELREMTISETYSPEKQDAK